MTVRIREVPWQVPLDLSKRGELELRYPDGRVVRGRIESIVLRGNELTFRFRWLADQTGDKWTKQPKGNLRPLVLVIGTVDELRNGTFMFTANAKGTKSEQLTCYLIPPRKGTLNQRKLLPAPSTRKRS